MATTTTKLLLRKPDPNATTGDFINVVTDINESMDKIDAAVGATICTSGTRPTGADRWDGREIYETDTRRNYMWSSTLSTWLPLLVGRGTDGPYLLGQSVDTTGEGINSRGSATTANMWRTRVTSDANPRHVIRADGQMEWGPGSAAADVVLSRSAANELSTATGDAFKVSGDYVCGSENGVSAASTTSGSDTTTSSTYVNMAGTGATTSFSFVKRWSGTRIRLDMHAIIYQSGGSFPYAMLGVQINSVDYDIVGAIISAAGTGTMFSGLRYVAAGVAANTYTVQARWKRVSGTGTLTRDTATWLSFSARECN